MQCPQKNQATEILLDYCAQKLKPETAALVESHIAGCPECKAFTDAQKNVWEALEDWNEIPISNNFDQRLYAKIEQQDRQSWWTRLHLPLGWRPALSLGAATIALFGILFLNRPVQDPNQPKLGTEELEQVEQALDDLEMLKQISPPSPG